MRILRRLSAWRNGVPFRLRDFWPPYYHRMKDSCFKDGFLVLDFRRPRIGEVIAVLSNDGRIFHYRCTDMRRTPGSDHVFDPMRYEFEFVRSSPLPVPTAFPVGRA